MRIISSTWKYMPVSIRCMILFFASFTTGFMVFRLGFIWYFRPVDFKPPFVQLIESLYLGLKFDARLAALLCMPLFLIILPKLNIFKNKSAQIFLRLYLVLVSAIIIVAYIFDFGAYSYIHKRLNAGLLLLLDAPEIALEMILSSYPWHVLIAAVIIFCVLLFIFIGRLLSQLAEKIPDNQSSKKNIVIYFITFFLFSGIIYGKCQWYPLRWSDAFVFNDSFLCQSTLNPILFFIDTMNEDPNDYDIDATRRVYPRMAKHFQVKNKLENLSLSRAGTPYPVVSDDWNVVLIFLETFASFKVGTMGNPLNSSPNFDDLANHGKLFNRFYVPMENTSRSLFAALFGIPDISLNRSSSRNPLVVNQHTILNALNNHHKFYFLGGSANWGNIRGMLAHNINGLQIYEEGNYSSPRLDVWGISDADLFMEANNILKKSTNQPFFAIIQTAGNHRPFSIPDNSRNFIRRNVDSKILEQHGFYSLEEYNGFRFLDHCLGYFFDLAAKEEYFKSTLFVILGDHGTVGGSTSRNFGDMALESIHVPLLMYAPEAISKSIIDGVVSELDLMPMIASFMGKDFVNTTLGRDALNLRVGDPGCAFVFTPFRRPPLYGLIQDNCYAIVDPTGQNHLYNLDDLQTITDLRAIEPVKYQELTGLAEGYYEMARYLLYHNQRK